MPEHEVLTTSLKAIWNRLQAGRWLSTDPGYPQEWDRQPAAGRENFRKAIMGPAPDDLPAVHYPDPAPLVKGEGQPELSPFTQWAPAFFPEGDAQPDADGLVWLYDAEGEKLLKVDPRRCKVVAAALELAYEATQYAGGALWEDEETAEQLLLLQARVQRPWTWPEEGR